MFLQENRSHLPNAHHVHRAPHSPPGRDRDAHEGFVPQQLPVKLLEVLELPFHLPGELSMGQLDGVNIGAWYLQREHHTRDKYLNKVIFLQLLMKEPTLD